MILVVALVAQLVAARGNPLCFDDIFTYELCCESDDGDACWAGDLTFETCCTTPSIEWESVSSSTFLEDSTEYFEVANHVGCTTIFRTS